MGPEEHPTPIRERFAIIGIAASAGGLVALSTVLQPMPDDLPVPIIIVQHLAPQTISILHQILQKQTHLRVKQAEHGEFAIAGVVYVAPPNRHLVVREGYLLKLED